MRFRKNLFVTVALGLFVLSPLWGGCATGGNGSNASDDGGTGDDAVTGDAVAADGTGGEGGSTSIDKACDDNAASYCAQLQQCAPFLLSTQYGDTVTCIARNKLGCMDALQAPGTGWTGANLEACVSARTALSCNDFLHGKPAPNPCRVTGMVPTSNACRYGAQCGTGYCRYASGASCGNCVTLGATGAPCTSSSDCDGNLMCASSGTCQPPSGVGGPCNSTTPCQQGLACIKSLCAQPGDVAAACDPANNGADCDYDKGVYCDSTSMACKPYVVAMNGQACGGATPTVCFGGASCQNMACVAPVQDGSPCDPTQGENCMPPSSCQMSLCQLYSATMCK